MVTQSTITFTTKGQVVIPLKLRRRLGIEAGTRAIVEEQDGKLILKPITAAYVSSMRGKFAGLDISTAELEQSRREDRKKENREKYA